jgi:hypothetical protein
LNPAYSAFYFMQQWLLSVAPGINLIGWEFTPDTIFIPGGENRNYRMYGVNVGAWILYFPDGHFDTLDAAQFDQSCVPVA